VRCSKVLEVCRHIALLEAGRQVPQETRGFDEERFETFSLRSKEDAPDYRYMPDSNLPPLLLTQVSPVDILTLYQVNECGP
jgi:aspartyl-tRNA(Asn)/glutamyl-tRNA(Gln) amidotransferase subunit B